MRKVLLATTALATVAGVASVASADVSISGAVQWQYTSISDDNTTRSSDSDMNSDNDITISFSTTTDSGITMSLSQNLSDGAAGTRSSSISADWGTLEFTEGSNSAHAGSSYDVTAPGTSGGYGDLAASIVTNAAGTAMGDLSTSSQMSINEAVLTDGENGALNYHSPSINGLSFGIGTSHNTRSDADSSTSYGIKYSGAAGEISYNVGYAAYDKGSNVESSHIGFDLSMGDITVGMGSANSKTSSTNDRDVISYGIVYAVNDSLTLGAGINKSDNDMSSAATKEELEVTTIGAVYTIAPGLTASLSSTSFDYKVGGSTNNDGAATQAEIKMSF